METTIKVFKKVCVFLLIMFFVFGVMKGFHKLGAISTEDADEKEALKVFCIEQGFTAVYYYSRWRCTKRVDGQQMEASVDYLKYQAAQEAK